MHVFIAPHLDDAIYSCGALIHQLSRTGEQVTIATVMTGDPPDPLPDSAFVRELHMRWFDGKNPFPARREEDIVAARLVGAKALHLGFHDAIYRTPAPDEPVLYPDRDSIFASVHSRDPMYALLSQPLPLVDTMTHVYLPLAVGHHVDHQLVRDWGIDSLTRLSPEVVVRFYEDYPYAESQEDIQLALEQFPLPRTLQPDPRVVSEVDYEAKCAAFIAYATQLSTFWPDEATMRDEVRRFMKRAVPGSLAEKLWALD